MSKIFVKIGNSLMSKLGKYSKMETFKKTINFQISSCYKNLILKIYKPKNRPDFVHLLKVL